MNYRALPMLVGFLSSSTSMNQKEVNWPKELSQDFRYKKGKNQWGSGVTDTFEIKLGLDELHLLLLDFKCVCPWFALMRLSNTQGCPSAVGSLACCSENT
eukprot:1156925-Pelagomonas_calceolata.AAC.4